MRIRAIRAGAAIVAGGVALPLAGCTNDGGERPRPMPRPTACKADRVQSLIGREADGRTVRMAQRMARARMVRVLRPGEGATMDFRQERLNIMVSERNRIVSLNCG